MSGTVLSMDAERAEAVDFSEPLYMDKQVIVNKKPVLESDLAGFMKPFTPSVGLPLSYLYLVLIDKQLYIYEIIFLVSLNTKGFQYLHGEFCILV